MHWMMILMMRDAHLRSVQEYAFYVFISEKMFIFVG